MSDPSLLEPLALAPDRIRRLRFDEYMQLAESGAFDDEKVELLDGVVVTMNAQGDVHLDLIVALTRLLARRLPDAYRVAPQCTYRLSDVSGPEPDFAVATTKAHRAHARDPRETWLIEVAVSSLHKDLGLKARLYAAAGIPEYWVIDANAMTVRVHRDPSPGGYLSIESHNETARLEARFVPELVFSLRDLLEDA